MINCVQSAEGGAIQAVGTRGSKLHITALRCILTDCSAATLVRIATCHRKPSVHIFFVQGGAFSAFQANLRLELCLLSNMRSAQVLASLIAVQAVDDSRDSVFVERRHHVPLVIFCNAHRVLNQKQQVCQCKTTAL